MSFCGADEVSLMKLKILFNASYTKITTYFPTIPSHLQPISFGAIILMGLQYLKGVYNKVLHMYIVIKKFSIAAYFSDF